MMIVNQLTQFNSSQVYYATKWSSTIMMARHADYAGKESACSIANHADGVEMR